MHINISQVIYYTMHVVLIFYFLSFSGTLVKICLIIFEYELIKYLIMKLILIIGLYLIASRNPLKSYET